jgi:hypothetical protein
MVSRRKKALLAALTVELLIAMAIIILLGQTPSAPTSQATPTVPGQVPPSLLVVPEVPFGTIAIVFACFLAFFIILRRPKIKPA